MIYVNNFKLKSSLSYAVTLLRETNKRRIVIKNADARRRISAARALHMHREFRAMRREYAHCTTACSSSPALVDASSEDESAHIRVHAPLSRARTVRFAPEELSFLLNPFTALSRVVIATSAPSSSSPRCSSFRDLSRFPVCRTLRNLLFFSRTSLSLSSFLRLPFERLLRRA